MAENNTVIEFKERNVYVHFDEFIETFLIGRKSYVLKASSQKEYDFKQAYEAFCKMSLGKEGFDKVVEEYEKSASPESLEILNHAIFLWCMPNNRKSKWVGKDTNVYVAMPTIGVAGGGSGYVQTKVNGVRFILYIFTQVLDFKTLDETKKGIIKICTQGQYSCDASKPNGEYTVPDGVKNLLLNMCDNDNYAPIASTNDKNKIVEAFWSKELGGDDLDSKIKAIYVNITESNSEQNPQVKPFRLNLLKQIVSNSTQDTTKKKNFSFYDDKVKYLWKGESLDGELSRVQLLKYKKAMVLYGPPGTGKTYTAMVLAKELLVSEIVNSTMKDDRDLCSEIEELEKYFTNNIDYLQFHVNYTYDCFIAGQIIENNSIKTKKGYIFDVIDKASKKENKNIPFVVILDEMNRVDVSRVFGELFTAIEKRGTEVQLTLPVPEPDSNDSTKRLVLNLPENVYFIGTMNEIDFSLEQIDFALRRRFVWELAGYDETALEDIITKNLEGSGGIDLNDYLESCTILNKYIETKLGKEFQIGHAFFAEIAKLYKECGKWDKAKNILWQMSIRPTIEAYCGAMDSEDCESFVKGCKEKFRV